MDVEVIRDEADGGLMFEVENPQPGFHYRMLNDNPRNLAKKRRRGYQIIDADCPEKLLFSDNTPLKKGADTDGTQRIADTILARIPDELWERNRQKVRAQQDRQSLSHASRLAAATGGLAFDGNAKSNTRYATGMTESKANELAARGELHGDMPDGKDD